MKTVPGYGEVLEEHRARSLPFKPRWSVNATAFAASLGAGVLNPRLSDDTLRFLLRAGLASNLV